MIKLRINCLNTVSIIMLTALFLAYNTACLRMFDTNHNLLLLSEHSLHACTFIHLI